MNLDRLRKRVRQYIEQQQYQSALFWADKVASLSHEEPQDVYWLAQCLYLTAQYHRASHALRSRKLDKMYEACRSLAARCHYAAKEYQQALDILDMEEPISKKLFDKGIKDEKILKDSSGEWQMSQSSIKSSICLLRGKIYDALDNRTLATYSYKEALKFDVYCFEAFDLLTAHHMLTAQEEKELLDSLPISKKCPEDQELLRFLFENKLKKYNKPSETVIPESVNGLQENLDVVVSLAERHYYNCDFKMCYKLTSAVMEKDPFHANCLPVHIGTLVELNKANELFYLSHKLVDLYPNNPVSWFAVGCYYLMVGHKNEHARRYLSKATTLERSYGPAWIAYGHSFAVESEHDQAMAAYFTAAQLMKGCHLPMLYIGLEYGLTNNSKLAERFFSQALSIAPEDPFVMHEVGVVAFQNGDWKTAEKWFLEALEKIRAIGNEVTVDKWEPLLNNLGHVRRKLKKYEDALEYHRQALVLIPQNASTYSAIGYIHSLMGNFESAIDYFHTALGLRRDDTFSVTMLGHCIEMYIGDSEAYIGTEIKDKLRCYDFDVHTMKTLKNIISSPWEVDMERQSLDVSGIMALESTNLLPKSSDARSPVEESLEIEMNESDMMLETSMSDHST
ncbi:PREDICTED: cell division cycle protein 16 homolog isoform X2 [Nanorana parkeri]|uniref:cell division cycle protein 16 homolog isoform X1 n=1 Tax=Nanorana parkeri TaxID=125878 RepID=UPI000854203D|nr:PREDICTED: cell division cycle protein 16 homolog isoform X1 [Nanorana parkeri]XP_018418499.1 PREDICTED: cell division cycle protein 16 homolog isoform X2 [Nanorana parkeri]